MSAVEVALRVGAGGTGALSAIFFAGMMLPVVVGQHRSPGHECVSPGLTCLWLLAGTQFAAALWQGSAPWVLQAVNVVVVSMANYSTLQWLRWGAGVPLAWFAAIAPAAFAAEAAMVFVWLALRNLDRAWLLFLLDLGPAGFTAIGFLPPIVQVIQAHSAVVIRPLFVALSYGGSIAGFLSVLLSPDSAVALGTVGPYVTHILFQTVNVGLILAYGTAAPRGDAEGGRKTNEPKVLEPIHAPEA